MLAYMELIKLTKHGGEFLLTTHVWFSIKIEWKIIENEIILKTLLNNFKMRDRSFSMDPHFSYAFPLNDKTHLLL